MIVDLEKILDELLALPSEAEWVEFKEAKSGFGTDDLGKYFSALSNEANLKARPYGWLILGVTNRPPRQLVGSQYKPTRASLDALKNEIIDRTTNRLSFVEIHELLREGKRILLFQIPPATPGVPTAWKGHYYGRDGEALGALNPYELRTIQAQILPDWSAQVVEGASIKDLDPEALSFARKQFATKFPAHVAEQNHWDEKTFLNKAKVCIQGEVTHTALLLLGREENTHFLSPAVAQLSWILQDGQGQSQDYAHFGPPLLLAVDRLLSKVRNLTVRHLPSGTLFPREVTQYDPWVMREVLHNCIAHQDYALRGRISVVERPDALLCTNVGSFIPGSVEDMIRADAPPERYRNKFLTDAMVNLNMIDTIGSGIKRMFELQQKRSFPMPDYDLGKPDQVSVRLTGRIIDERYTSLLLNKLDVDLWDAIALDKVQKKKPLRDEEFRRLKDLHLIEGRRPRLFVAAQVAAAVGGEVDWVKNRGFNRAYYKDLVMAYLEKFGEARRSDLDRLVVDKLPNGMSTKAKSNYVRDLLQEMRKEKLIQAHGATRWARWRRYSGD